MKAFRSEFRALVMVFTMFPSVLAWCLDEGHPSRDNTVRLRARRSRAVYQSAACYGAGCWSKVHPTRDSTVRFETPAFHSSSDLQLVAPQVFRTLSEEPLAAVAPEAAIGRRS